MAHALIAEDVAGFAADIRSGLLKREQKELPSKYLYDDLGSRLFDAICLLPEYGLTRADERLLRQHAPEIARRLPGDFAIAELGSGNGKKTRWILEAFGRRRLTSYFPIEISRAALDVCCQELSGIDGIGIEGIESEYLDGLQEVAAQREPGQRLLVLFLGSTLGNFEPPADRRFLRQIRGVLDADDVLLIGTDLEKPVDRMLAAYDDSLGVTAAFNRNVLARMNRELGADFALPHFRHEARFNFSSRSVEMHLRATSDQQVTISGADLTIDIAAGETIWTESSHKYSLREIEVLAASAGFRRDAQWVDQEWPFAETLLIAV